MKIMNNNLTHLKKYRSVWVAIDTEKKNKIVGSGKTVKQVLTQAKAKGYSAPFITKVPKDYNTYIL